MADRDLITEGRQAVAAASLFPGPDGPCDPRKAVEVQLRSPHGHFNARLMLWALDNVPALLDELEQARARIGFLESEHENATGWRRVAQWWRRHAIARRGELDTMYDVLDHTLARIAELEAERDKGYRDRAEVVALLAAIFPSKMADPSDESGWPVLYLDTPEGQLSWHINPADLDLFNTEMYALALDEDPDSAPVWDGHTNEQKSVRLHRLATCYQPADFLVEPHEIDQLRGSIAAWQMNDRAQRARIAELEAAAKRGPIGYATAYRTPEGAWLIEFDGEPFPTREAARADLRDAADHCLPGLSVPVGFVVLAKRPDRHEKDAFRYEVAGSIWPTRDPVESHRGYCEGTAAADPERYRGVEYVTGEVREVPDGP